MIIIYVLVLMILTPLAFEQFNKQMLLPGTVLYRFKDLPAFTINLVICVVFGIVVCVVPYGAGFSFTNWVVYAALIFLGNQIFFQFVIKMWSKYRNP